MIARPQNNESTRKPRVGLVRLGCLVLLALPSALTAQTNPAAPQIPQRPLVVAPNGPQNTSPDQVNIPPRPERPPTPGKPAATTEMQKLVRDFQAARETYIRQQQELNRKLSTATDEQRALIREQIKESLREWRELQKQQAKDLREQAESIKNNTPNYRDVINHGGGDGRGR